MRRQVFIVVLAVAGTSLGRGRATGGPAALAQEASLESYRNAAQRIIAASRRDRGAYRKLEELCDDVGHRLSGSENLERAVEWAVRTMQKDGHDNVRAEPVMVPRWVRGRESIEMVEPRRQPLVMLGLGGSVGTPPGGLTAEVVVVADESELNALGDRVRGKMVLFNNAMPPYDPVKGSGYGSAVRYRHRGPRLAAQKGAVACLVRSVTAVSLRSPHTGATGYDESVRKIPAAAVSIEDAELLARLTARGKRVVLQLNMEARDEGLTPSANVVGELRGRTRPDEVVVIGGHLDSWDVGQGAHDDGAGCVMAMEAITLLRSLDLVPQRTIRVVLFTNEENGLAGARQYVKDHEAEMPRHVAAIESDSGGFRPEGFSVDFADEGRRGRAVRRLESFAPLLAPLDAARITAGGSGADVGQMKSFGVPLMGLNVEGSRYFDYHHTHADTFDKIDPRDLSDATSALAIMAYLLADMPGVLGE